MTHDQCHARPTVTSPAAQHHSRLGTKLYCSVTKVDERFIHGRWLKARWPGIDPATCCSQVQRHKYTAEPHEPHATVFYMHETELTKENLKGKPASMRILQNQLYSP